MTLVRTPPKSWALPLSLGAAVLLAATGVAGGVWWFAGVAGNPASDRTIPKSADSKSSPLALVVSGDTAGWIVPCGCTANQSGGLLRRGAFVAQQRNRGEVIVVDAGGTPSGTSLYDRLKFAAILKGEHALGVAAHNVGGPEAALEASELKRLMQESGVPLISANLRDLEGRPIWDGSRIVEAGGRRILFIGVLSQRYANARCRIDEPRDAILATLVANQGRYDAAVVLAYLAESELRDLAASLPEVDAVVGGPTGQSIAPTSIGPALVASATNKGKFLVRLDVPPAGRKSPWSGEVVELTSAFPDDPVQTSLLAEFRQVLATRDVTAAESGLISPLGGSLPGDYRIAGSRSCQHCHDGDYHNWQQTKHALAWSTLVERGAQMDSSCQKCHTTGFGEPGGFVSAGRSAERVGVGCESCHGPAQSHVEQPRKHAPFAAKDQCAHCHDHENSPLFEFAAYWQKIAHGEPASAEEPAVAVPRSEA